MWLHQRFRFNNVLVPVYQTSKTPKRKKTHTKLLISPDMFVIYCTEHLLDVRANFLWPDSRTENRLDTCEKCNKLAPAWPLARVINSVVLCKIRLEYFYHLSNAYLECKLMLFCTKGESSNQGHCGPLRYIIDFRGLIVKYPCFISCSGPVEGSWLCTLTLDCAQRRISRVVVSK